MKNFTKSLFLLLAITASMSVWADPVASGELFATYQKHGDTFYRGNTTIDGDNPDGRDLDIDYYLVSCGQTMLFRAKNPGGDINFGDAGWEVQLRVYNDAGGSQTEIQACTVVDPHHHYTGSGCQTQFTATTEDLQIHFFLSSNVDGGYRRNNTFDFNRASINNPIEDNVAPTLDLTKVTQTEDGADLVFTFGDGAVTASEEFFYYVADKDHNIGNISLNNEVRITKPTVEDGTKYTFKCYAVDYNGNKSAYKEFTLEMPFDEELDLAFQKSCTAGFYNGGDVPANAVNGENNHWGTWSISDFSLNWWRVDLNNAYNLSEIDVEFEYPNTYKIEGSIDGLSWTEILRANVEPSANTLIQHTGLAASARYLRLTALGEKAISIRHFKVYATGVAAADATNPTVSVECTAKTVNSATLQIVAADKDDADNDGTITSIKVTGDNGFAEQEVLTELDGENKVTLSGLTYNTTYHFTVTAYDLAGNSKSENVEVVLPFNTELNLALNKTATASAVQLAGVEEDKAVDGNSSTFWTCYGIGTDESDIWWQVDLGTVYDVNRVVITFNDIAAAYNIYASDNGTDWIAVAVGETASSGGTKTHSGLVLAARYFKVNSSNNHFGIKEFEVYGTGFSTADATDPTVSVTCPNKTINSATLQIDASDLDDAGEAGSIAVINISGDNGFETQNNVTLNGSNQITLSGLTYNTTYTFTVTVQDRRRNEASTNIVVQLPLNTNFNLAEGKTAVAGKIQAEGNSAIKGCDGDLGTTFSTFGTEDHSKEYWYVDLEDIYTIRQVAITWGNDYSKHFLIQGATTLPEESVREDDDAWTTYLDYTYESDPGSTKQEHALVGKMRYLRLKSLQNEIHLGINFKELEVYGSDYAELDETAPVIGTKECTTDTETSTATFTLTATDAVDGAIKDFYISCADPVIAEAKYTTNASDQFAISGLDNTKDYTFLVRCRDLSGNWAETSVIAHFAMALGTNVAEGKTATAGSTEGDNVASYAVDGNKEDNNRWGNYGQATEGNNWWKVDLVNAFKLSNIAITWETSPTGGYVIEGSLNGSTYTAITSYSSDVLSGRTRQVLEVTGDHANTPYRYVRISANTQTNFMSFYEFEVYASEEIVLLSFDDDATDNSDFIAAHHNEVANVTLNRTIAADNTWYTLCLPFDMSTEKVTEVFGSSKIAELKNSENRGSLIHLNFDYVNAIEAGHAYLFKPGNDFAAGTIIEGVTIKNVTPIVSGDELMHFQGTYDQTVLTADNIRFVADDDYLYSPAEGGTTMGAFRCYFTIPAGSPASAPGMWARIVVGTQVETGMESVPASESYIQKVLRDGQLLIIRDGRTYNAQGGLMK